ncbi:hypothetical protein UA08_09001 [Talaromyces atroroseus]|uniref:Uncharacterized protein n=1 Tax=Talaromyces atroroseus TaxID=1441469 RepID=A0A1Q5Q762_TALAT|nr:hypothetical protein UA08_09001 [Talaromyces atroroseus]OKL55684.1 hypothetical protein UA08_09001 [Talaromyces atroroseus]
MKTTFVLSALLGLGLALPTPEMNTREVDPFLGAKNVWNRDTEADPFLGAKNVWNRDTEADPFLGAKNADPFLGAKNVWNRGEDDIAIGHGITWD